MAQEQAPNSPRLPVKFTTVGGSLSAEGLEVLEQMWRQIVAGFVVVPCEASGTNALALTPVMHEEGARTVADHMAFAFVAAATSTAAVTAAVGDLPALKVYKDGGETQAGQDDIVADRLYLAIYNAALDSGNGGLVLFGTPSSLTLTKTGAFARPLTLVSAYETNSAGPFLALDRRSPSPAANDYLGLIAFYGRDSVDAETLYAYIAAQIVDPTNGSEDGQITFATMVAGTLANRMYLAQGLVVGSPTGADKGAGTINATAVYDDNVLLTCYALEAATKGSVDAEKWDEVAGREHKPARAFAERIGDLEPETFAEKWKASGVLPGMPTPEEWTDAGGFSTGNIIQRLWEIAEVQAVHIAKLTDRIAALEGAPRRIP